MPANTRDNSPWNPLYSVLLARSGIHQVQHAVSIFVHNESNVLTVFRQIEFVYVPWNARSEKSMLLRGQIHVPQSLELGILVRRDINPLVTLAEHSTGIGDLHTSAFRRDQRLLSARRVDEPEVAFVGGRSEEHTSELQSRPHLVCRLLLEK